MMDWGEGIVLGNADQSNVNASSKESQGRYLDAWLRSDLVQNNKKAARSHTAQEREHDVTREKLQWSVQHV